MRIQNILYEKRTAKKAALLAVTAGMFVASIILTPSENGTAASVANTSSSRQTEANQTAGSINTSDHLQPEDPSAEENLTFSMVRSAFAHHTVAEIDFQQYANGKRNDFDYEGVLNYLFQFSFSFEQETYDLQLSYNKENDQLMDIYIVRLSDRQMQWLYTVDEEKGELYPNDLQTYLDTKIEIGDWLTLDLPEGYTLGDYRGDIGYCGGALISPRVYVPKIEDSFSPLHWNYAGFVGKVSAPEDVFVFENGKLNPDRFPRSNHSTELPVGIMDTVTPGSGWVTLLVRGCHDLYTAADLCELEQNGEDLSSLETESNYWYFYFVKEDGHEAYVLSLSAKEFTKAEAVSIAQTVQMAED